MTKIMNLTQHNATPPQKDEGVVDMTPRAQEELRRLLTFDTPPSSEEIVERSRAIAAMAHPGNFDESVGDTAMIGGALFLMAPLAHELRKVGVKSIFAFSTRDSVEEVQEDGTVLKKNVFRHGGFVDAVHRLY